MAKKITIAELEIETKSLEKANTKLIGDISKLRKEQKALKKETNNLTEATEEQRQKYVENDVQLKKSTKTYNDNKKVLAETQTGMEGLNDALNQNTTTVKEAQKANRNLKTIRNQLKGSTEEEKNAISEINKKIDENDEFIRGNVSEREKQILNVGNYKDSIVDAAKQTNIFGGSMKEVSQVINIFNPIFNSLKVQMVSITNNFFQGTKATQSMSRAQKALAVVTNVTSKAFKFLKLALISTGIGAIVVAIGLLVAALARSEKFTDGLTKALAPLTGAFEALMGVVQDLAFSFDTFSKEILQYFKDQFTIVTGKVLNNIDKMRLAWNKMTGDTEEVTEIQERMEERQKDITVAIERSSVASEKFGKFLKDSSDRIKDGARTQREIVDLGIEIEKSENRLIITRSELNKQIKEQNKITEDITRSENERRIAAEKAIALSNQLLKVTN